VLIAVVKQTLPDDDSGFTGFIHGCACLFAVLVVIDEVFVSFLALSTSVIAFIRHITRRFIDRF
jgi:hypothetical protein